MHTHTHGVYFVFGTLLSFHARLCPSNLKVCCVLYGNVDVFSAQKVCPRMPFLVCLCPSVSHVTFCYIHVLKYIVVFHKLAFFLRAAHVSFAVVTSRVDSWTKSSKSAKLIVLRTKPGLFVLFVFCLNRQSVNTEKCVRGTFKM